MIEKIVALIASVCVLWFFVEVWMNDHHYNRLIEYWGYWLGIAHRADMELTLEAGGFDDAPCQARFKLEGRFARVICGPWKMIRILRALRNESLQEKQLIGMSIWPATRLPR